MVLIKGKPAKECTKEVILGALETVTAQRDNLKNANAVINEVCGQQYAEIELLRMELNVIKKEIEAIHDFRTKGGAN